MRNDKAEWLPLGRGRNRYQIHHDVLYFEPHGPLALDDALALMELADKLSRQYGFVYCIVDAADAENSNAAVRKQLAEEQRRLGAIGTTYIFGANVVVQTFAILWQNMNRLMGRTRNRLFFVRTEQEGWEEIARERAERSQTAASV